MKYFIKLARRRKNNDSWKGLTYGAAGGAAAAIVTHPVEHSLYGQGKNVWKHLGARVFKAGLASGAGFGTYHFLNTLSKRRKSRVNKVNTQMKKFKVPKMKRPKNIKIPKYSSKNKGSGYVHYDWD